MTANFTVQVTLTSITGEQHIVQPGSRHYDCATAGYVVARIPETAHEEYDAEFECLIHHEPFDCPTATILEDLERRKLGDIEREYARGRDYVQSHEIRCRECKAIKHESDFRASDRHGDKICRQCRNNADARYRRTQRKAIPSHLKGTAWGDTRNSIPGLSAKNGGVPTCTKGHPMTVDNIKWEPSPNLSGKKYGKCRQCIREAEAAWKEREREAVA